MTKQRWTVLASIGKFLRTIAERPSVLAILLFLLVSAGAEPCQAREALAAPGITEPISDVTLSSTTVGTISRIAVKEGMPVKKGEVILELEQRVEELEVKRRKLLWESKAEVKAAADRVATLKPILAATRELFQSTRSVSKEELDKLQLEYDIAVTEQERLETAEERERIEYEMARETLRKLSLRSPIQGTVIKLFLEEGESFEENRPLIRVVDTSRGVFVANVEEWMGRTLKKGQAVDLRIKMGEGFGTKRGMIVFVSPVVDPASGLLEVKAEFDNADGSVRPGISGSLFLRSR